MAKRKYKRKTKRKSNKKKKSKSISKSVSCRDRLKNKIRINMHEYKSGRYKSRQQAIAVSYSQIRKMYPQCIKR